MLVVKPIGAIIFLRSIGERWSLGVICVDGVVGFGGMKVPVLFIERVGLWGGGWYLVGVGMELLGVCEVCLRTYRASVLDF